MASSTSSEPVEKSQKKLSPDQLLHRVRTLEQQLKDAREELQKARAAADKVSLDKAIAAYSSRVFQQSPSTPYDPSKYSTRFIALKFAYLGQNYNGFEHSANNVTPLKTIEEVVWTALVKTRLIWPADGDTQRVNWTDCEYSKCGRTDRGVSAFGQVIGIRVRSNRPLPPENTEKLRQADDETDIGASKEATNNSLADLEPPTSSASLGDGGVDVATNDHEPNKLDTSETLASSAEPDFDDIRDEIRYIQVLNQVLPPDVRILAWCPAPPENFSARFSCRERRYRYFFTQPAYNPTPGITGFGRSYTQDARGNQRREGWLDIELMRQAAKRFEGWHDFRNFCKVDASKQIENFERRIFLSEIREVDSSERAAAYVTKRGFAETINGLDITETNAVAKPKVYQFVLHGSAFLWHQVRHMVAVLFLVGQGLEKPEIIDQLLDVEQNPQKPTYEMAEDAPLVLWDCIFPDEATESREDALKWIWIGETAPMEKDYKDKDQFGSLGVVSKLWQLWRARKIDELLAGSLLTLAAGIGGGKGNEIDKVNPAWRVESSTPIFKGGDTALGRGQYVPVMKRHRTETPEVLNAKYREKKGIAKKAPPGNGKE